MSSEPRTSLTLRLPMTRLGYIAESIGVDRHQFHGHFKVSGRPTGYPAVYGGGEDLRARMLVEPNAYVEPVSRAAAAVYERYASRVLLPDRIWWDTARAIALYSREPVLANMFYAVRLRVRGPARDYAEKALVLWLNTTWGLLTVLFSREETRGRWTSLKISQWRLLPVLDVAKLGVHVLKRLAGVFDALSTAKLARVPRQFDPERPDPSRLSIDLGFLEAVSPGAARRAEPALLRLYERVHSAFNAWMRGG